MDGAVDGLNEVPDIVFQRLRIMRQGSREGSTVQSQWRVRRVIMEARWEEALMERYTARRGRQSKLVMGSSRDEGGF
jgi:hypothetical protein